MKRHLIFIVRLMTIFVFAGIIAGVGGYISLFISIELFHMEDIDSFFSVVAMLLFGIVFGYRLNDVIRDYKAKRDTLPPELLLSK